MKNTLPGGFNIVEASMKDIIAALEAGEVTSRELVIKYLERVAEIDKSGVKLNSVIELNPDVLPMADVLDYERETGTIRGVLHGVPLLIKGNINTYDKMHTSAGYPSITVPAGYTRDGEPMGITFTGLAYSEPELIGLAYAYEQGTNKRIPPKI